MKELKIGTYNIAAGRLVGLDMSVIAKDILRQELDIIGIQEVDLNTNRSNYIDIMKALSLHTGYKYYAFFKALDLGFYEGFEGQYGIGILSKHPIISSEKTMINQGDEAAGVESRALGHCIIDINGEEINFFTTHLTIRRDEDRIEEFKLIAKKTKGLKNMILTGDFNTRSFSEFSPLAHFTMVNNAETPFESFPGDHRFIDNIIFSSEFSLSENSVGMRMNDHSDHYMLYATLNY